MFINPDSDINKSFVIVNWFIAVGVRSSQSDYQLNEFITIPVLVVSHFQLSW